MDRESYDFTRGQIDSLGQTPGTVGTTQIRDSNPPAANKFSEDSVAQQIERENRRE